MLRWADCAKLWLVGAVLLLGFSVFPDRRCACSAAQVFEVATTSALCLRRRAACHCC